MVKSRADLNRKIPRLRGAGDRCLDIQVYLNVVPFVDSALLTEGVGVLLRVLAGHAECCELPVIS